MKTHQLSYNFVYCFSYLGLQLMRKQSTDGILYNIDHNIAFLCFSNFCTLSQNTYKEVDGMAIKQYVKLLHILKSWSRYVVSELIKISKKYMYSIFFLFDNHIQKYKEETTHSISVLVFRYPRLIQFYPNLPIIFYLTVNNNKHGISQ